MSIATMDTVAVATTALATVTALEFAAHRTAMLRFARRKIRDEDLAEDAVQDALAAALASRDSFQGKSAVRTWLIGILNHKIQDVFRRESRYVRQSAPEGSDGDGAREDPLAETLAAVAAADLTDPAREVSRRRMRDALLVEIEALPPTLKDVFVLQVMENVPTEDVCRRLQITEANCWVRLHRARKRLAERMQDHLD